MTDAPIPKLHTMSIGDFIRRYDDEGPFEFIRGEIIPMSPTKMRHNRIAATLIALLNQIVWNNKLGYVFAEAPFVLEDKTNWVKGSRVPDVMFVSADRLATYEESTPDWEDKPLVLVPDLAVEIVSPTDSYQDISRKIEVYLEDGVKLAWVIDPKMQIIDVYTQGSNQFTRLKSNNTLTAEGIIEGLAIPIADIFA